MSAPAGEGPSGRRVAYALVVGVAAVAAFAIALARFLPLDPFVQPVVDDLATRSGVVVRYRDSHLVWRGIRLTDVEITGAGATAAEPPLVIEQLVMRPSLMSVLRGRGGYPWHVSADLLAGSVTGRLHGQPPAWRADLDWHGIDLGRLPQRAGGTLTLAGLCDGHVEAQGPESEAGAPAGSWRLSGAEVSATGLRSGQLELPQIALGQVESTGTWQGSKLTVESLNTHGPLGSTSLTGRVVLRVPVEQSALNLRLTHSPPPPGSAGLSGMTSLLFPEGSAVPRGPRTYHVGGTLGLPAVQAAGLH